MGFNFQIDSHAWVDNQDPTVEDFRLNWNSEWTALRYSNLLLSMSHVKFTYSGQRFGSRRRVYVAHFSKPLSRSILRELESDFGDAMLETSKHRFRNEGKDVNTIFLHTHYIIERHRETLLEAYLMHRADIDGDGNLDQHERQNLVAEIHAAMNRSVPRDSLKRQPQALASVKLPVPKVSQPVWLSSDGFPFAIYAPTGGEKSEYPPTYNIEDAPDNRPPAFPFVEHCLTTQFVTGDLSGEYVDTATLFKILAKEFPYCGDMLLSILVASEPSGLAHILPPPSHPEYSRLVSQLHKYAYIIATTRSEFIMARSADTLSTGFDRILELQKDITVGQFCVNDDVEIADGSWIRKMDATFRGILHGYYGGFNEDRGRSPVEKIGSVDIVNRFGLKFWNRHSVRGGPEYHT
jgi:Stealth protein CR3, conserved region 3